MKKQYFGRFGPWAVLFIINLVVFVIKIITKDYDRLLVSVCVMLFIVSLEIQEYRVYLKDKLCEYYKKRIQELEEK